MKKTKKITVTKEEMNKIIKLAKKRRTEEIFKDIENSRTLIGDCRDYNIIKKKWLK